MYRDVNGPNRSMATLMRNILDRLSRIEQRIRWPGATQIDAPLSAPELAGDGSWETIASLTLDPGVWLILAGATFEAPAQFFNTVYEMRGRVVPDFAGGEAFASGLAPTSVTTTDGIVLQGTLSLSEATTVDFEMSYFNYTAGEPDAPVEDPYLIAVPA